MISRFSIIGLGLIGGSVARAIKSKISHAQVCAYDLDADALQLAKQQGIIDSGATTIEAAVTDAQLVILAMPVGAFKPVFESLKSLWREDMIVTDVASVKAAIQQQALDVFQQMPANLVLGHPLAGSDQKGVQASKAELFSGSRVVLTPSEQTAAESVTIVTQFWQQLGANVTCMPVQQHDNIVALTSHLPHVMAFAFMKHFMSEHDAPQNLNYTAGGYRDFTRIAHSSPALWADICLANSDALLLELQQVQQQLSTIEQALQQGDRECLLQSFGWQN